MAELSLYRGEKSKVKNYPMKDGQVLIGTISEKTAAIYIDTKNKFDKLVRVEIDFSEYAEKITDLEIELELIKRSVSNNLVLYEALQTTDGVNIVTDNGEIIICADK